MYKGIGEAAYNDGLFSQAAPYAPFQGSVSQFGDGGLGSVSRLVSSRPSRPVKRLGRGSARPHPLVGMGRTFLPAFNGIGTVVRDGSLGHVYNGGVLGDDTVAIPGVTSSSDAAQDTKIAALQDNVKKIAIGGAVLALAVGYLYMKR